MGPMIGCDRGITQPYGQEIVRVIKKIVRGPWLDVTEALNRQQPIGSHVIKLCLLNIDFNVDFYHV